MNQIPPTKATPASPDIEPKEFQPLFDRIAEGAGERERGRILPFEAIDWIRQARLGALRVPAANGGGGRSIRELLAIIIRLAAADANVAHILRNHFNIVDLLLLRPATEQERLWQNAVADGAIIGLAMTELETSQVGNVTYHTTLTADGDNYRLNGTKYYSTGTLYADYVLVRATGPDSKPASVILPVKREGIELIDDWDGMGQRLTATGTSHFRNVAVIAQEVIFDRPGVGYGTPYANTFAQLFLTAVNAGVARAATNDAAALVRSRRRTFYFAPGQTTTTDPILQQIVGQISCNAFAAESVVLAAAAALEEVPVAVEGSVATAEAVEASLLAAKAKVIADDCAIRNGSLLFDVGSASSTKKAANLDRHWRNARTLSSHNPTAYKALAVGDYEVNGTPPPAKGFF